MPIQHLIHQVETRKRVPRDVRPEWMSGWIEEVSELFEPLTGVARVGFDCRFLEDGWNISLFLGNSEVVGGPDDGKCRPTNFQLDLMQLQRMFDEVDSLRWNAIPAELEAEQEEEGAHRSFVMISGLIEKTPVDLHLFELPPETAGPGVRVFPDGSCEPA